MDGYFVTDHHTGAVPGPVKADRRGPPTQGRKQKAPPAVRRGERSFEEVLSAVMADVEGLSGTRWWAQQDSNL